MSKDPQPGKTALTPVVEGKITVTGKVQPRLIRHSPATDPKKVESVRASVKKLQATIEANARLKIKATLKAKPTVVKAKKAPVTSDESHAEDLEDLDLPLITPG